MKHPSPLSPNIAFLFLVLFLPVFLSFKCAILFVLFLSHLPPALFLLLRHSSSFFFHSSLYSVFSSKPASKFSLFSDILFLTISPLLNHLLLILKSYLLLLSPFPKVDGRQKNVLHKNRLQVSEESVYKSGPHPKTSPDTHPDIQTCLSVVGHS